MRHLRLGLHSRHLLGTHFKVGHLHVSPHDLLLAKEFKCLSHVLVIKMADTFLAYIAIYQPAIRLSHCLWLPYHQLNVI